MNTNNKLNKAKFLISHPNFSGLQFNQLTRSEIPAHFINFVRVEQDGDLIFEASPDISLSEEEPPQSTAILFISTICLLLIHKLLKRFQRLELLRYQMNLFYHQSNLLLHYEFLDK